MNIFFRQARLAMILLSLLSAFVSNAQQGNELWKPVDEAAIIKTRERTITPSSYLTMRLDLQAMRSLLAQAPAENPAAGFQNGLELSLPMPDGSFAKFRVVNSPVMEPQLSAKFPMISTFSAQGVEDPAAVARLDVTEHGFHAMIASPGGWFFIDPYVLGNSQDYIIYDKRHSQPGPFICEVQSLPVTGSLPSVERSSGTQLKTYRLAVAATGEYTAFYGGTVSGAMSGIVTTVNRVTGVYELELAVRFVLVANNNLIVYTNSSTDPYTNNNGSTMLNQNQTNINAVIGSANYDVGHVFSTGGGGIAQLAVICGSSKARGVTGSSAPIGDAFDIDYVAHEMGHQFGANHTFNGNAGSCNGNRNASTAYEPGSGTTIMAYAGICSPQDIQPHSDPIFHTKSFDEIQNHITTGSGSTCPVVTSTNNAPPVINAGSNYTIPYLTPFTLTGSATDANGDVLTHLWEEYDLGSSGAPNSPTGNAPIFRVFTPTTDPSRTFPQISDIVNNTQTMGEILPSYARTLNFKFTARDNRANGGGVTNNDTPVQVTVINTGSPFTVTAPNTGVTWSSGTTQTVTWNVASTISSPISCANVNIYLSLDGGYTYPQTLFLNTPNDGSQTITVPAVNTTQARVKVQGAGNIFFDISDQNFTIVPGGGPLTSITTMPLAVSSICAGQPIQVQYTVNNNANAGNIFTAQLSNSSGSFASPVNIGTLSAVSSGTINAIIPALTPAGSGYRIRVISSSPSVTGSNNGSNLAVYQSVGTAGLISGPATVCAGQSNIAYSVAPVANATSYNWSLPPGATIVSGMNTNSILVDFASNAVSGSISVNGANPGCSGASSPSFSVSVNPLPSAAGIISGATQVCQNQTGVVYSVGSIANATSYQWTLPSGASIVSGSGTAAITVSFGPSAVSGTISVSGINGCGAGTTSQLSVNVSASPTPAVLSAGGSTALCPGGSVNLSFVPGSGVTYQWRKDGVDISGQTGSSYTANTAGTYDVVTSNPSASTQSFTNNTTGSIPDASCTGVSRSVTVSGYSGTVQTSGITVKVNISHTYIADLVIMLITPSGDTLGLTNRRGGSGNNLINTVFSDAGATVLPNFGAPYTGTYKPESTLFTVCSHTTDISSFGSIGGGNINPNGVWTLKVFDRAFQDDGDLNNWTLTLPESGNGCQSISNAITVTNAPVPLISSFSPSSGGPATPVTINGSGFVNVSSVLFNGTPATFTVNSQNQISTMVPAGATNGFITVTTPCGTASSASQFIVNSTVTLNIKLFIEGFYTGSGLMNGAVSLSVCDTIDVSLASGTSPNAIVHTVRSTINRNGNGSFVFPGSVMGQSYYIVVKHRNSLQTWSSAPVNFSSASRSYDFTTAASQAFGGNQASLGGGVYGIRSGDVDQDGDIDDADYSLIEDAASLFYSGYIPYDLTGDNFSESEDFSLIENNAVIHYTLARP